MRLGNKRNILSAQLQSKVCLHKVGSGVEKFHSLEPFGYTSSAIVCPRHSRTVSRKPVSLVCTCLTSRTCKLHLNEASCKNMCRLFYCIFDMDSPIQLYWQICVYTELKHTIAFYCKEVEQFSKTPRSKRVHAFSRIL